MGRFVIFAIAAAVGCAKLHANVDASLHPGPRKYHPRPSGLPYVVRYPLLQEGGSPTRNTESLWFIPWDLRRGASGNHRTLDELTAALEDSMLGGSYWVNPVIFLRDLLELKAALVAQVLQDMDRPTPKVSTAKALEVLHTLFHIYAYIETPLPGPVEGHHYGAGATMEKVVNASDMFWKFAARTWPGAFTNNSPPSQGWRELLDFTRFCCSSTRRAKRIRKLRKLLTHLQAAKESMFGIYFRLSAVNRLSSDLVRVLNKHRPLTA